MEILPPKNEYLNFVDLVKNLSDKAVPRQTAAVLTFNYDIVLDFAFYVRKIPINYFVDNIKNTSVPLLKLHGSTNWGKCPECEKIMYGSFDDPSVIVPEKIKDIRGDKLRINFRSDMKKLKCCCGKHLPSEPFIIPPTWNKTNDHAQISSVWEQAAKELSGAEYIFISGYSMPETDVFFRQLFALGTEGPKLIKRITIFDKDDKVGERFKNFLGPGASDKFSEAMLPSFENLPEDLNNLFGTR